MTSNGTEHPLPPKTGILYLPGDEVVQEMKDLRNFTIRVPAHDERVLRLFGMPFSELSKITRTVSESDASDLMRLAIFLSKELERAGQGSHQLNVISDALVARTALLLEDYGIKKLEIDEALVTVARRCADIVLERPGDRLSVNQLADLCLCSPRQLFRALEQVMQVTPHEFVNRLRLHEARALLIAEPGTDLKRIAARCGFPVTSRFIAAFEKEYGMLPQEMLARRIEAIRRYKESCERVEVSCT